MGREAKVLKQRECKVCCSQLLYTNAQGLKDHADLCKRAEEAGLILPGISKV